MKSGFLVLATILAAVVAFFLPLPGTSQSPPGGGRGGFGKGGFGGFKGRGGPPPPPAGPFTRLPDGHPNLQGYWNGPAVTNIQAKGRGGRPGPIIDPPDGMIPYTPEAAAKAKEIGDHHMADEPELHCYESGVPHSQMVQFGFQIVQTPTYFVELWEFMHTYRIIPIDGRPHISPSLKLFQGDPVGHWEGDTLVVDTTNQNDRTWFDTSGNFKTDALHVTEKFIPVDANTIDYEATMTDPSIYTRPWTAKVTFRRNLQKMSDGRNYEQMEFGCIEGNEDVGHYTEDKGGAAKQVLGAKPNQ